MPVLEYVLLSLSQEKTKKIIIMTKVGVDSVNKRVQFTLVSSLIGVSMSIVGATFEDLKDANLKVELIRKNSANATLTETTLGTYKDIMTTFFPNLKDGQVMFALNENLILSENAKLQVTLDWSKTSAEITDFGYSENREYDETGEPLVLKKVVVNGDVEVSSETFPMILFSERVKSVESSKLVKNQYGEMESKKEQYTYDYMASISPNKSKFVGLTADNGQIFRVSTNGPAEVYLVNV